MSTLTAAQRVHAFIHRHGDDLDPAANDVYIDTYVAGTRHVVDRATLEELVAADALNETLRCALRDLLGHIDTVMEKGRDPLWIKQREDEIRRLAWQPHLPALPPGTKPTFVLSGAGVEKPVFHGAQRVLRDYQTRALRDYQTKQALQKAAHALQGAIKLVTEYPPPGPEDDKLAGKFAWFVDVVREIEQKHFDPHRAPAEAVSRLHRAIDTVTADVSGAVRWVPEAELTNAVAAGVAEGEQERAELRAALVAANERAEKAEAEVRDVRSRADGRLLTVAGELRTIMTSLLVAVSGAKTDAPPGDVDGV